MKTRTIQNIDEPTRLPSSLELLRTSSRFGRTGVTLLLLLAAVAGGLVLIPWQQSVTGNGRVFVADPADRPQNVEAQIPARIVSWHVQEGERVKTGQKIAELADIDSKFLDQSLVERLETQRLAQLSKIEAARNRVSALEGQLASVSRSRSVAVPSADEKARQNVDKLRGAEQSVEAARQSLKTTELNKARIAELHSQGLRSKRDLEVVELEQVRAKTDLERATATLEVARRDISIGDFDRQKVDADTEASVNSLTASLAQARESIATAESDLQKLEIEIRNTTERRRQNVVTAPTDGQIVRVMKVGAGATVKAGDVLAVIAPTTENKAVELMLSDNDAPLVAVGRRVRLQFAGFPAVQFTGYEKLAVGTFAGRVAVIDPIDDGKNRYRAIVVPDWDAINAGTEQAWASNQVLRPGSEAVGWIMLDTVPLGFELWRQFNGFPPSVQQEPLGKPSHEKTLDSEFDIKSVYKK